MALADFHKPHLVAISCFCEFIKFDLCTFHQVIFSVCLCMLGKSA